MPLFTRSLTSALRFSLRPEEVSLEAAGLLLPICARSDNATNWNATVLKQICNHRWSAFLA